jgi:hypothetical protein
MKVIYIAGPFRGRSAWDIECNVRRAETVALAVWRAGAAVICPHTNTRFFQGAAPDDDRLNGYLEIAKRCDAILVLPESLSSTDTQAERELAGKLDIPIFYTKRIHDEPHFLPPALIDFLRRV